jgi:hypothetical protein
LYYFTATNNYFNSEIPKYLPLLYSLPSQFLTNQLYHQSLLYSSKSNLSTHFINEFKTNLNTHLSLPSSYSVDTDLNTLFRYKRLPSESNPKKIDYIDYYNNHSNIYLTNSSDSNFYTNANLPKLVKNNSLIISDTRTINFKLLYIIKNLKLLEIFTKYQNNFIFNKLRCVNRRGVVSKINYIGKNAYHSYVSTKYFFKNKYLYKYIFSTNFSKKFTFTKYLYKYFSINKLYINRKTNKMFFQKHSFTHLINKIQNNKKQPYTTTSNNSSKAVRLSWGKKPKNFKIFYKI